METPVMNKDSLWDIVSNNPQLAQLVEQRAMINWQNQQRQMMQQQNQGYNNPTVGRSFRWDPGTAQYQQGNQPVQTNNNTAAPATNAAVAATAGGEAVQGQQQMNPLDIAQKIFDQIMASFEAINKNIKGLADGVEGDMSQIKKEIAALSAQVENLFAPRKESSIIKSAKTEEK